jgi:Pectinacetylesterase
MRLTNRRGAVSAAAIMLAAGLLAACGGSGSGAPRAATSLDQGTTTTTGNESAASGTTTPATTDGSTPADSATADTATTSDPVQEAAFEYAQCLRDNGIEDYPDPQVSEDGGVWLVSPLDVTTAGTEELAAAQEACEHIIKEAVPSSVVPDGSAPDGTEASGSSGAGDSEWDKVVPGGDCVCADGSEFAFWERQADPTKVVFYLDGGGACWDATTCAFTGINGENDFYNWSLADENPAFPGGGILDFDRADNPFADYSFIYVGSCTGDGDLGDVTREYSPELTVEHNGFVNGTAALAFLAEHYPDAAQVVVVGNTGGSVAAPVYGGLVADLLPDAQVTVFGAGSGHWPDDPDLNAEILAELWGVYDNMPDWEVNEGLTARDWGIPRFWIQAGLHDPDIVQARFDFAYDPNATRALESIGVDSSTLELIDANEAAIEAAGVVQHSYIAPGEGHRILELDSFYELEVNGVTLVDWVEALVTGKPLDDVHCEDCETP